MVERFHGSPEPSGSANIRVAEFDVVKFLPRSTPAVLKVYNILRRYCLDQATDLSRVTFRHIVRFLDTGVERIEVEIAGGLCGYTLLDLRELRATGAKGVDVAREIVSRGPGHPGAKAGARDPEEEIVEGGRVIKVSLDE